MSRYSKLAIVVLGATATTVAADISLEERQLQSLPPVGATSSSSSSTITTPSSSLPSITPISTLTTQTGPLRWELTTVFTQPTECVGGITEYAGDLSTLGYWVNIPFPAPGVTLTSCFPPALVPSVTASVDQPPYEQLVCPYQWESFDYNATYRICCPKNFGFYLPDTDTDRPGLGAWCTSWARPGTHAALTRYNTNGGSTLIDTTLGTAEGWMVQATAFDGTIATAVPTSAASSTTSSSSSISRSSSSISTPMSTITTTSSSTTSITHATTTSSWTGQTDYGALPTCGKNCIANMLGQYKQLGCGPFDIACACRAPNFNYGVRDCASAACNAADASTVIAFETSYWCPMNMATGTHSPTITAAPTYSGITDYASIPACGKTCIGNMLGKYSELGCGPFNIACACRAPNFNYGVHDCATAACNAADATTVISFETSYWCPSYMAKTTDSPTLAPTPTAISDLPSCGQTCMNNMIGQYSQLGCSSPDPACLCGKPNFGYGVRDCANGACGAAVAPTVTNFASSHYCSPTPAH